MRCKICGTNLGDDLFSAVTGEKTCSICTVNHVGGIINDVTIEKARQRLGLKPGEYLTQDNSEEARKLLGR